MCRKSWNRMRGSLVLQMSRIHSWVRDRGCRACRSTWATTKLSPSGRRPRRSCSSACLALCAFILAIVVPDKANRAGSARLRLFVANAVLGLLGALDDRQPAKIVTKLDVTPPQRKDLTRMSPRAIPA